MPETKEVRVPDIGDFQDVEIIEVAVSPGDRVEPEQALITIESDKATMDVPSPEAGTVRELHVSVGDKVSEGSLIVTLETEEARADATAEGSREDEGERERTRGGAGREEAESGRRAAAASGGDGAAAEAGDVDLRAEVLVLGSGPGGYTAAFRAADLGKRTVLVERYATLGGVCLNVGCIPSKALLHTAELINGARAMAEHGVRFGDPEIDPARLASWKDEVVGRLTKGLAGLAKQREVQVVQGTGEFVSPNMLVAQTADGEVRIGFEHAIIAAGSQAASIPGLPEDDPRVMDSTDALALDEIPGRLLVVGGGIIGLEMATVYHALGSKVTVVELMDRLMTGCDRDLVRPLEKRIRRQYEAIYLGTKVTAVEAKKKDLEVRFEGEDAPETARFDRILVAVGRRPNGGRIGAEAAGVRVDNRDFIPADREQRTNVPHIFAIGDIAGEPLLAHKATHEGKVAAEVAAGHKASFDAMAIPSVAYTDPEVAWTGVTEEQAKEEGIDYESATFPWAASGRSLGMGRNEGLTKLLFDKDTKRVIGAGIVGPHAGDLVSEANLALEMGADAADLALTIHPHPTLSETVCFAAEMAEGTITDLYAPKRK